MNAPYDKVPKLQKPRTPFLPGLIWWTTLLVAVMAVPLVGTSVALAATDSPFLQMVLFIFSCWACVWLGMWLVKRADEHDRKHRR